MGLMTLTRLFSHSSLRGGEARIGYVQLAWGGLPGVVPMVCGRDNTRVLIQKRLGSSLMPLRVVMSIYSAGFVDRMDL